MATQVSQAVYDYVAGERARFQQQADALAAQRDDAERARADSQRFADGAQAILNDLTVSP